MSAVSLYIYKIHIDSGRGGGVGGQFFETYSIQLGPDVKIACFFIYASSFYSTPWVCWTLAFLVILYSICHTYG